MSFQGSAPLVSSSELTYFPGLTNAGFSWSAAAGLFVTLNSSGPYRSLFSVNASGPETDNVYVGVAVGLVSGSATRILCGFVKDATHFFVASPGGSGGFLFEVEFVINNGTTQSVHDVAVSPHIPYDTSATFLTQYMAIAGTIATVYAINQSTGLLTQLASFDAAAIVTAAQLQTWSAGLYFDGTGVTSVTEKNLVWGPTSDLLPKTVPNVVGETQAQATIDIIAAGLTLGLVTVVASDLPSGQVLTQTPAAGTLANFGAPVAVTVASGPSRFLQAKFVPAKSFLSIMTANPGDINPRVYPPHDDTTVRVIPRTIT